MKTTLDGQSLFEEQGLEINLESPKRDSVERSTAGLDGVMSIDLGQRSRQIKQRGVLRAKSQTNMDGIVDSISAYLDGDTYTLITNKGRKFENLRMDVFKIKNERTSGGSICCDYEIVYTQLAV